MGDKMNDDFEIKDKRGEPHKRDLLKEAKVAKEAKKGKKSIRKLRCPIRTCSFIAKSDQFLYNAQIQMSICPRCGIAFMEQGMLKLALSRMSGPQVIKGGKEE
jgi:hypothetical protein